MTIGSLFYVIMFILFFGYIGIIFGLFFLVVLFKAIFDSYSVLTGVFVGNEIRELRLIKFAQDNNFELWLDSKHKIDSNSGTIFTHLQEVKTAIVSYEDNVEIGIIPENKDQGLYKSYICFNLDKKMPHMIIDAKINNLFGMDSYFSKYESIEQNMDHEGDFINKFRIFVPEGYRQDVLYILTPDFMALLVDEFYEYDIEFIDDKVYLYKTGKYDLLDKQTYKELDEVISTFKSGLRKRTKRYKFKALVGNNDEGDSSERVVLESYFSKYNLLLIIAIAAILLFFGIDAWIQTNEIIICILWAQYYYFR